MWVLVLGVGLGVDKQILNVCKLGTFIVGNHCVRCLELSLFVHHPLDLIILSSTLFRYYIREILKFNI